MSAEPTPRAAGLRVFLWTALALWILRVGIGELRVPEAVAGLLNVLATIVFLAVPILALYKAAEHPWSARLALAFLIGGVAAHVLGVLVSRTVVREGLGAVALEALAQTGLMFWTVGLGALVALLIKDRNLLVPIAIFLAGFDAFLILTPTSLPQQIMQKRPEVFQSVAVQIPGVGVGPQAFAGPADFFFLTMFFVALHKFGMRTAQTLKWMVPVLLAYLAVVIFFGGVRVGPISLGALPALVPIGITVLLVNRDQFRMKPDEKVATAVVGLIAIALAAVGYTNALKAARAPKAPPAEPAIQVPVPAPKAPATSP